MKRLKQGQELVFKIGEVTLYYRVEHNYLKFYDSSPRSYVDNCGRRNNTILNLLGMTYDSMGDTVNSIIPGYNCQESAWPYGFPTPQGNELKNLTKITEWIFTAIEGRQSPATKEDIIKHLGLCLKS